MARHRGHFSGSHHTVGLNAHGRVHAAGDNTYRQCEVDSWEGVVAVATGSAHTLALRADGSVLATGDNTNGQCDVGDFSL